MGERIGVCCCGKTVRDGKLSDGALPCNLPGAERRNRQVEFSVHALQKQEGRGTPYRPKSFPPPLLHLPTPFLFPSGAWVLVVRGCGGFTRARDFGGAEISDRDARARTGSAKGG
jgi:hypothetical protein